MGGKLPRALAEARNSIRAMVPPGGKVLVACSGGADSLALAAAAAFLHRKMEIDAGAVIIDHRMQPGSTEVAHRAAAQCRELGLGEVLVLRVNVDGGSEQAARTARYAAFGEALRQTGADHVLLGHTLDDQAEQVLLGLARGSGTLSLAGMPAARGPYLRPLLALGRADVELICRHEGLEYWNDPSNTDPRYLRNRVRHELMPVLLGVLGDHVPAALARTAALARADAEYLDGLAAGALSEATLAAPAAAGGADDGAAATVCDLDLARLRAMPEPLRSRALRLAVVKAGAPAPDFERLAALEALVLGSKSAGPVQLEGPVFATRLAGARLPAGAIPVLRLDATALRRGRG
ncbi:tRNA lysidine(34) synthetase TilS [Paeniglutamicibacter sp. ABSL32-1]|uniref:tRNA lysidine(34) synthetase TilS n=1 Tax=Paeniglutamicibacter quisquiliarum TaxID=2849498 RepID=UPI001C2CFC11|nr:tRNA lysidine(34) synthetase TilS [Paeniglutamicibacter quisquiliarum]MBV1781128.1 tRNA lysidine(34) synthetase TilS [Paeniglutamicibacter quisquiliarum]